MKRVWGGLVLLAALSARPAAGYEILLDIDLDDDPSTQNTISFESSVTVRIILSPSEPEETISEIEFGLGGTCWNCEGVFDYGTAFDLHPPDYGDWTDSPSLIGSWDMATCLQCCSTPGFHYVYRASAVDGSFVLTEPVFIATFQAWQDEPMWGTCPVPPSNLAAFSLTVPGEYWNYVEIGGDAPLPVIGSTWGRIKALYDHVPAGTWP